MTKDDISAENKHLELSVKDEVDRFYPEYTVDVFSEKQSEIIDNIQSFIDQNNTIYAEREKYDLKWALKNSQEKIDSFVKEAYQTTTSQIQDIKENHPHLLEEYKENLVRRRRNRIKRKINYYNITSFFISFIDIVISLLLIILVSKIGHLGESLFESAILALLFFTFISMLKVTLDRLFIIPKVHQWGWKKYRDINQGYEDKAPKILAVSFIAKYLYDEGKSEEIISFIKKVKEEVQ